MRFYHQDFHVIWPALLSDGVICSSQPHVSIQSWPFKKKNQLHLHIPTLSSEQLYLSALKRAHSSRNNKRQTWKKQESLQSVSVINCSTINSSNFTKLVVWGSLLISLWSTTNPRDLTTALTEQLDQSIQGIYPHTVGSRNRPKNGPVSPPRWSGGMRIPEGKIALKFL